MLALTFLNPLLLWAVPLASVPIIIHLLNRRRFQRVPWAAMEYLLAALKRNRKRLRMEQWLVLLLRTLAVLLLAFLVTRPQFAGSALLGSRIHHVAVIDDTASMLQMSGSRNLWESAQDKVRQLADRLSETRGGDLFSLVRVSAFTQPDLWGQPVGPELGRNVGKVLKEFPAGDGTMDLASVLTETRKRAVSTEAAGRSEYYLFSDQRSVDWLTEDDKARSPIVAALAAMDPRVEHVQMHTIGSRDADNLGIVAVRRVDRLALAGVPVELAVDVQNHGLDATPAVELAIEMDGGSRVTRPVPQLAPGEKVSIPVTHTFHAAGFHRVEASFAPVDHFLVDDRRSMSLPVQERSKVLLVDGEPDDTLEGGETMFLQVALDPGGEQPSGVEPQVVVESSLGEVDLSQFDMVWLCNVPVPALPVVGRLEQFVAAGGGLVIFCGGQVDVAAYNEALWRGGQGLLPLPLGEVAGDPDRREHVVMTAKDHPMCGNLGDLLEILVNATVLVKRYLRIEEPDGAKAAVVARIRDPEGPPAIVTRSFGNGGGTVVLLALSADKHWSNLPDTDVNLVLAHQIHRFAARTRDLSEFNLTTAGTFRAELDPGHYKADVELRSLAADGEQRTITAAERKSSEGATEERAKVLDLVVPMAELRQTGAFEVTFQSHSGTAETRYFARNLVTAESKLVRLQQVDFARAYPPEVHDRLAFFDENSGLGETTGEGEIWKLLAAAMLAALLLETLLAWRFGRR